MTPPQGGWVEYLATPQSVLTVDDRQLPTKLVTRREAGGFKIPSSLWEINYCRTVSNGVCDPFGPSNEAQTVVTEPGGRTEFFHEHSLDYATVFLKTVKTYSPTNTLLQVASHQWESRAGIGAEGGYYALINPPKRPDPRPLLPKVVTTTRDTKSFTTTYAYRGTDFDDFLHPSSVSEAGDFVRTTDYTYRNAFGSSSAPRYIGGRVSTAALTVAGESFTSSYTYDANGFLTSETVRGTTTTFLPDTHGNVAQETNARDNTTRYESRFGIRRKVTTPSYYPTATVERTVNPDGTLASETLRRRAVNADGSEGAWEDLTTTLSYDLLGRETVRVHPTSPSGPRDVSKTVYSDAPNGSTVLSGRAPSPNGTIATSWTKTFLDGYGRPLATERAALGTVGGQSGYVRTEVTYDAHGRVVFETDPFIGSTSSTGYWTTYDALGRLTSRKHTNEATGDGYNYDGISVSITDARHNTTHQNWQAAGSPSKPRLASLVDARGKTTIYTHNALDQVRTVQPAGVTDCASGGCRTFSYTSQGRLEEEVHPESGRTSYQYDEVGNIHIVEEKTLANVVTARYVHTYDADDRRTRTDTYLSEPGGTLSQRADYTTNWTYDALNSKRTMGNGHASSMFFYNEANHVRERRDVIEGNTFVTQFLYDAADRLDTVIYPGFWNGSGLPTTSGRRVKRTWNAGDQVVQVDEVSASGSVLRTFAEAIQYWPSGVTASYVDGNATVATVADSRGRVTDMGRSTWQTSYHYDPAGNVDSEGGYSRSYDALNRLTTADGPWGGATWDYDDVGNLAAFHINQNTPILSQYQDGRLTLRGSESFQYFEDGSLKQDGVGTYAYAPFHMLEQASVGAVPITFAYDGDQVRKAKTVAGDTRLYVHGLSEELLTEYRSSGATVTWLRDYIYLGSQLLASVKAGPVVAFANPSTAVSEGAGSVSVQVVASSPDGSRLANTVSLSCSLEGITAALGADFSAQSGCAVMTWPTGSDSGASKTVVVTLVDDAESEVSETFRIVIRSGSTVVAQHVVSIEDNEPPVLSLQGPVAAGLGYDLNLAARFRLQLARASSADVTVHFTLGGTAQLDVDYTLGSTVVSDSGGTYHTVIPAGALLGEPIFWTQSDGYADGQETLTLTVTAVDGPATLVGNSSATVPIQEGSTSIWYFAEGNVGAFFDEEVLVVNPNPQTALVEATFYLTPQGGTPRVLSYSFAVEGERRKTLSLEAVPGLLAALGSATNGDVSLTLVSTIPVVAERSMYWNAQGGAEPRGGHNGGGQTLPLRDWYFAEGTTNGDFATYFTLFNPGRTPVTVDATFYLQGQRLCLPVLPGGPGVWPDCGAITIAPEGRHTILASDLLGPNVSFGARFHAWTNAVIVERAMYFNGWKGGHLTAGESFLRKKWLFAEGSTRTTPDFGFDTFFLLSNPTASASTVTLRFYPDDGSVVDPVVIVVPAYDRANVWANTITALAGKSFGTVVTSTQTIMAERAMYWDGFIEGHATVGARSAETRWWFAEGVQGSPAGVTAPTETYLLVLNDQTAAADIRATFMREGAAPLVVDYTVPAGQRLTIAAGAVPQLVNQRFAVKLESLNAVKFVAERATYWGQPGACGHGGLCWYGGHASVGRVWPVGP
ncbi:MAG: Calx-beta domain-containing protein [Vicinamibacterales bacterium]